MPQSILLHEACQSLNGGAYVPHAFSFPSSHGKAAVYRQPRREDCRITSASPALHAPPQYTQEGKRMPIQTGTAPQSSWHNFTNNETIYFPPARGTVGVLVKHQPAQAAVAMNQPAKRDPANRRPSEK